MKNDVVQVEIRGLLPVNNGCAIFVGNDEKVFVIQVDHNVGMVISNFMRSETKERPLTHDLLLMILQGLGVTVERVVITELRNATYYARIILQQENELGRKLLEVDARPSDSIALAIAQKKPIYVTRRLFDQVEDMSEALTRLSESSSDAEQA
ncbi:MAG: bifunctional nuclease family protein [Verrucomicrobia bacterium]|nr:bifunctional nuclease family protein [Verrucomicrobiota bacterium]